MNPSRKPRVLLVLHNGGGPVELHTRSLAEGVKDDIEQFMLKPDDQMLELWKHQNEQWEIVQRWERDRSWDIRRARDPQIKAVTEQVLRERNIDLVHVQHLRGHTLDVLEVPRSLGVPVVLSVHDHYLACPSYQLLDQSWQQCRGTCTPGEGSCQLGTWFDGSVPLKHRFVHLWRRENASALAGVDRIVVPDPVTDAQLREVYPDLDRIEVAATTYDTGRPRVVCRFPAGDEPVRLVALGGLPATRGLGAIYAALGAADGQLTVDVLGELGSAVMSRHTYEAGQPYLRRHGDVDRAQLAPTLASIRPTFAVVWPMWDDPSAQGVIDAWAHGIPVVVPDRGAPAVLVREYGGGVVVDADPTRNDGALLAEAALHYGRNRSAYDRLAARASVPAPYWPAAAAAAWVERYQRLIEASSMATIT
ncbi:MAG: glycosyltransferase [Acidimicrobiales bacterium]|nr:glycosyltransferase [Acidimicrobiales bacterium]